MKTTPLTILAGLLIAGVQNTPAADTFQICSDGYLRFFSATPIEDIEAISNYAVGMFNPATLQLTIKVRNDSFQFPNKLMQKHFNDNYMESEKYPSSTFEGKVSGLDSATVAAGLPDTVMVDGSLDVHGTKLPRSVKAVLQRLPDGTWKGETVFPVKVADHKIEVPSLLTKNIAESVEVTARFHWKPYTKSHS